MMKKVILIIVLVGIVGTIYGILQYNKGPVSIANNTTDVEIDAITLFEEFKADEQRFNEQYLDKVLEITGDVKKVKKGKEFTTVKLASSDPLFGINCQMSPSNNKDISNFKKGDVVTLKGKCTGTLMDVIVSKCVYKK